MSIIDFDWLKTELGNTMLNSVKHNGKLKNFGLLEKPTLAPTFQFKEVSFKISITGKSYVGKTSFINSLCSNKQHISSLLNETRIEANYYNETPGIYITHLYWPVKIVNNNKFLMLNLSAWDVGRLYSSKYEYITPSCEMNTNCYLFVFSWTDKQSFIELFDQIKRANQSNIPYLIIGTKFDQIVHSEIELEAVRELEELSRVKIIRFSMKTCSQDQIYFIMNRLAELLINKKDY